jgi:ATP-dependent DNA helicase RecQ
VLTERVVKFGHHKLSTYGIGRDRSEDDWRTVANQLVQAGFLTKDGEYPILRVTEPGHRVLYKGEKVLVSVAIGDSSPAAAQTRTGLGRVRLGDTQDPAQPNEDLFQRLRLIRKSVAGERGIPPYMVFHDGTLRRMAAALPADRDQLLRVPGVGEGKATSFGALFLDEVSAYIRETGAQPSAGFDRPASRLRTSGSLSLSVRTSLQMFQEGKDVDQIAQERGYVPSTIENHLTQAIEAGELLDLTRIVAPERLRTIEAAMLELGHEYLAPVRERLGEEFTYQELNLVRATLQAAETRASGVP